jgi:tryptophan 2,3-dioxygenase
MLTECYRRHLHISATRVRLVEHVRILTITTSCDVVSSHVKWTGRSGLRSLQARTVTFELGTRTR